MAQIVVRGIDDEVMRLFKERARARGESAEQAVRDLIVNAVVEAADRRKWLEQTVLFRERLREQYGDFPRSDEIIREERDRR